MVFEGMTPICTENLCSQLRTLGDPFASNFLSSANLMDQELVSVQRNSQRSSNSTTRDYVSQFLGTCSDGLVASVRFRPATPMITKVRTDFCGSYGDEWHTCDTRSRHFSMCRTSTDPGHGGGGSKRWKGAENLSTFWAPQLHQQPYARRQFCAYSSRVCLVY